MKKTVLSIALCLAFGGASFAQKNVLKNAKADIEESSPNYDDIRTSLKGALSNPETGNDPETWFVAGSLENKQFSSEQAKELIKQTPNYDVMYKSLSGVLPYFLKADSLDQLPNDKGKVKPRFRSKIKDIVKVDRPYYINGGAYYFDKKNYDDAYKFFNTYLEIPNLAMFQGDKLNPDNDTLTPQIKYYAAITASQLGKTADAIKLYESLKSSNYKSNEVYQYLCYEYQRNKDSVNLVKTLQEGVQKFPNESYYLLNLINQYIYSNRNDEALSYLNKAIEQKPNDAQLYDVVGRVYENKKDYDNAEKYFNLALEKNPNYTESLGNLGRIYYNKAVEFQGKANAIKDNRQYNEAVKQIQALFTKALPYFEKAHAAKPDDRDYMVALRGIYYSLNMADKLKSIEDQLGISGK